MKRANKKGGGGNHTPLLTKQEQFILFPLKKQHQHFKVSYFDDVNVGHLFKITKALKYSLVYLRERGKKGATRFEAMSDEHIFCLEQHVSYFRQHGLIIESRWVKNRRVGSKHVRYFLRTGVEITQIGGKND